MKHKTSQGDVTINYGIRFLTKTCVLLGGNELHAPSQLAFGISVRIECKKLSLGFKKLVLKLDVTTRVRCLCDQSVKAESS